LNMSVFHAATKIHLVWCILLLHMGCYCISEAVDPQGQYQLVQDEGDTTKTRRFHKQWKTYHEKFTNVAGAEYENESKYAGKDKKAQGYHAKRLAFRQKYYAALRKDQARKSKSLPKEGRAKEKEEKSLPKEAKALPKEEKSLPKEARSSAAAKGKGQESMKATEKRGVQPEDVEQYLDNLNKGSKA